MVSAGTMLDKEVLRRRALTWVWAGEAWNILEAGVALWSAKSAASVALLGYGLDTLIELFAGGVLIWHLGHEWRAESHAEVSEKKALRLVGVTFLLLAAYILVQAVLTLFGRSAEPQKSPVGIGLVIASALVMAVIVFPKTRLARKLGSSALREEAMESLVCSIQSVTVLIGLGANALWGWWWADPVAALALIPFLLKEGSESINGEPGKTEDEG